MKPADLLIENAAQILTLSAGENALKAEEKLGIVTNGSIAIAKGRIVWVGPDHQISQQIDLSGNPRRIDASGKIVLPGLIDSHTHLVFAGAREKEFEHRLQGATYQEIAAKGGGIKSTVQKTRQASKEELFQVGKRHLDQMLSLGTTTVEAKSGYGLSTKDEIKMLEVLRDLDRAHFVDVVPTFLGAHEIPPEYAGKKDD
jgi:imidazolonepropionase